MALNRCGSVLIVSFFLILSLNSGTLFEVNGSVAPRTTSQQTSTTNNNKNNTKQFFPVNATKEPRIEQTFRLWNYEEYPIVNRQNGQCLAGRQQFKHQQQQLQQSAQNGTTFAGSELLLRLCDPDALLQSHEIEQLNAILVQISAISKCYCRVCGEGGITSIPVGVALARNIFKNYNEPENESNQRFANQLRSKWRIGFCDNDILLLVVAGQSGEVLLTTSIGVVASNVIDPIVLHGIINSTQVNEYFTQGKLFKGLLFVLNGMKHYLKTTGKAPPKPKGIERDRSEKTEVDLDSIEEPTEETLEENTYHVRTALLVLGVILGFLMVITILLGLIVHTKQRFQQVPTSTDPREDHPQGYFTQEETQDAPALPENPPPKESPSSRRVTTPDGQVEYEPVSIEDQDSQQTAPSSPRKFSRKESGEHTNLHGKDDLLEPIDDQADVSETGDNVKESRS